MGVTSVFGALFSSRRTALLVLFFLSFVYFLENFDRSLISVSPIPYIDYGSYEYSILAGPAFTIVYTLGGVLFALMSFTEQQFGAVTGVTSTSFTKFNILAITTLVFSVSFACTALAGYFWQQVLIRIAMGLSQSVITPFSTSIISDYFPPEVRGSAFGIFNLGTYISFSLSLSLGVWIYVECGWQAGYFIFGVIGVACAAAMPLLSCTARREEAREEEEQLRNREPSADPTISSLPSDLQDRYSTHSLMHSFEERDLTPSMEGDRSSIREFVLAVTGDGAQGTYWGYCSSRVRSMTALAYDICFVKWYNSPGVYLMLLATGVRLGAGYIWVAYTGAFFSDLFESEADSSCEFSYNASFASSPSNVCDSDYPYCVEGGCSALASFPWHNKGMDSLHLVEYMAWVPIVGSAFGNVLGGFISDHFIVTQAADRDTEEDEKAGGGGDGEGDGSGGMRGRLLSGDSSGSPRRSVNRKLIPTAVGSAGEDRSSAPDFSVHGQGRSRHSAAPSASASAPARPVDQSVRMLVAGLSNLLPVPLVVCALLAEFPYCFLIMIVSGMMGEMYMAQAMAAITDVAVTPLPYIAPSVALFMFVITIIGGNAPLLIPLISSLVGFDGKVNLSFTAASEYAGVDSGAVTVEYTVRHQDARQLQFALIYVFAFCYGLSGILFLASYWQMRRHRRP